MTIWISPCNEHKFQEQKIAKIIWKVRNVKIEQGLFCDIDAFILYRYFNADISLEMSYL